MAGPYDLNFIVLNFMVVFLINIFIIIIFLFPHVLVSVSFIYLIS